MSFPLLLLLEQSAAAATALAVVVPTSNLRCGGNAGGYGRVPSSFIGSFVTAAVCWRTMPIYARRVHGPAAAVPSLQRKQLFFALASTSYNSYICSPGCLTVWLLLQAASVCAMPLCRSVAQPPNSSPAKQ